MFYGESLALITDNTLIEFLYVYKRGVKGLELQPLHSSICLLFIVLYCKITAIVIYQMQLKQRP